MINLENIKKPINKELIKFNEFFQNYLKEDHILLRHILLYLSKRKGKQIRPIFVLLIAKLNGEINEKTYIGATLIELLHTATLVHDDIIDNSELRRGFFSLKSLWGNKIAVLIGDYLLSKGLLLSLKTRNTDLLEILSEAVQDMAEGELLQLKKARFMNFSEEDYYEIIRKKTAMLIAAAGSIGAKSVGSSPETIKKMKNFGTLIGMAFQIKDDILDLEKSKFTGKIYGNDLRDRKITLPLIKTLQNATNVDRKRLIKLLNIKNKSYSDINQIIFLIEKYKGIKLAEKKLIELKNKALNILEPYPSSDIKQSLIDFVEYNINRKR